MKIIKPMMGTALAIGFTIAAFIESADAKKASPDGDSNTVKILEFEIDSEKPETIQNIFLKNPTIEDRPNLTEEQLRNLIQPNTELGEVFGQDDEARVNIFSRQKIDLNSDLGSSYSELITFDVDDLLFEQFSEGELTLYWLVPKNMNIDASSVDALSDLLNFPEDSIENSFNAVLDKYGFDEDNKEQDEDVEDVFQLNPNLGEFDSNFFPFEENPAAEPFGPQLNSNLQFSWNIEESPDSKNIPEPSYTISLLALGALGVGLLLKRKMQKS